ncbi:MAG: DUF427 domain-containing protein [Anaerolineales bacterium]
MPRAIYNGTIIAESDQTQMVEGNHYFPPDAVKWDYLSRTDHSTVCPWKGTASYYTLQVDGEEQANAAWQYETPKDAAQNIKDHIAFYTRFVTVES